MSAKCWLCRFAQGANVTQHAMWCPVELEGLPRIRAIEDYFVGYKIGRAGFTLSSKKRWSQRRVSGNYIGLADRAKSVEQREAEKRDFV